MKNVKGEIVMSAVIAALFLRLSAYRQIEREIVAFWRETQIVEVTR